MIGVSLGARAAGARANATINGVAEIARAMGSLGNTGTCGNGGSVAAAGDTGCDAGAHAADGDAAAGDAADAAARAAAPTPSQVLHIGGKKVQNAPRIRLVPMAAPKHVPRLVPPPKKEPPSQREPCGESEAPPAKRLKEHHDEDKAPGTRSKAPPASTRTIRLRHPRINQACVISTIFLFIKKNCVLKI